MLEPRLAPGHGGATREEPIPLNNRTNLKARWRVAVAASAALLGAATPALGQEASAPAQNALIGNPQLRDFSINGTVTRPAETPVEAPNQSDQPAAGAPAEQPRTATPRAADPPAGARAGASSTQPPQEPSAAAVDLPPPTPGGRNAAVLMPPEETQRPGRDAAFGSAAPDVGLRASQSEVPFLPWLAAALALAGLGAWYFLRQRPREAFAGTGISSAFAAGPTAPPAAPPVRSPPAAAPSKPSAPAAVGTRLRPWLDLEFTPQRALVDNDKAAIVFGLSILNSGGAPARDVLVEVALFNAGPMHDQQILQFFDRKGEGERIREIAPLQKFTVDSAVVLPRELVRPIEVEGRTLFVPMVALNAAYRWSAGLGQTAVSYVVGKATAGDKLAPFRLDLGPRVFRNLAARKHELRRRT